MAGRTALVTTDTKIGDTTYMLSVHAYSTRNGFAHEAEIYNTTTREYTSATVQYYNRTWEKYYGQTALSNAAHKIAEEIEKNIKAQLMEENGWKRLSPNRNEILHQRLINDKGYAQARTLIDRISTWEF